MSEPALPTAKACCLFLDIDGTLLEYAPTPDEVRVDAPLLELLRRLAADAHLDDPRAVRRWLEAFLLREAAC